MTLRAIKKPLMKLHAAVQTRVSRPVDRQFTRMVHGSPIGPQNRTKSTAGISEIVHLVLQRRKAFNFIDPSLYGTLWTGAVHQRATDFRTFPLKLGKQSFCCLLFLFAYLFSLSCITLQVDSTFNPFPCQRLAHCRRCPPANKRPLETPTKLGSH